MNSRQRVLTSLDHHEPDRVPYDLASTQVTGIAIRAYECLRAHLGLAQRPTQVCDIIQQLALPDEDLMDRLGVDTRGLYPLCSNNIPLPPGGEAWKKHHNRTDEGWVYVDEWGLTQFLQAEDGLYYSVIDQPLGGPEVTVAQIELLDLPSGDEAWRFEGLRETAQAFRDAGKAVVLKGICAGLVEMSERLRGMDNFLVDLLANPAEGEALMDRFLEIKLRYWTAAAEAVGELVDVVMEADDYGTQESQLISPEMFRQLIKPRLRELIGRVRTLLPEAKVLFHSCGSVRPIIPDFIELGIDVLNPVHVRAAGMEPTALKRDFGADLSFWGGGVDTQGVLPNGTPDQVREDVRRNVDALATGGGWVFNTVHNIQVDVPPQNVMAMWEALQEFGTY